MPELVGYLLLFIFLAVFFVFIHLVIGRFIRPIKPDAEKLTIYECGEPTVGSAWIQFDLRFYVVALLFVIFDVEVAFFFPWAVVFGKSTELARDNLPAVQRRQIAEELQQAGTLRQRLKQLEIQLDKASGPESAQIKTDIAALERTLAQIAEKAPASAAPAMRFSLIAFLDILVFFGILLVGFAYLWKRGDLNWVRSLTGEDVAAQEGPPVIETETETRELVGAGHDH